MTKTLILTAALIGGIALPSLTMAQTPNRTTMTFEKFVNALGCEIVTASDGTTKNLAKIGGGNCPSTVVLAWTGNSHKATPGADGILGTTDDGQTSDN